MTQAARNDRPSVLPDKYAGRATFLIPEVAGILGLSISSTYGAVASGRIKHIRFGRRLIIPRWALEDVLTAP